MLTSLFNAYHYVPTILYCKKEVCRDLNYKESFQNFEVF